MKLTISLLRKILNEFYLYVLFHHVISPLARKRNLDFSAGNTAGNQRKMPSSGAPVIVRVGVRIAVRVADVVRIRVHTFVRVAVPVRVWCMTLSLQQQSILLLVQTDRQVCWWKCICKNLVSIWWSRPSHEVLTTLSQSRWQLCLLICRPVSYLMRFGMVCCENSRSVKTMHVM